MVTTSQWIRDSTKWPGVFQSTIPPSDGMLGQYSGLTPPDFHVQVPIYTLQRREAIWEWKVFPENSFLVNQHEVCIVEILANPVLLFCKFMQVNSIADQFNIQYWRQITTLTMAQTWTTWSRLYALTTRPCAFHIIFFGTNLWHFRKYPYQPKEGDWIFQGGVSPALKHILRGEKLKYKSVAGCC